MCSANTENQRFRRATFLPVDSQNSSFSGSECYLAYDESTALVTNKMIVVESGLWSDTPMLDEAHCTTDEAEKRAKTMPCKMHEHIEATKL